MSARAASEEELSGALRELAESRRAKIRVGFPRWLQPFLQKGVVAITLGRWIYLHPQLLLRKEKYESIVRHELVHVHQVTELGLPRFLFLYLWHYFEARRRGVSARDAYEQHPFEVAARQAEQEGL